MNIGLTFEHLYLVVEKYHNDREVGTLKIVYEPDFKSTLDIGLCLTSQEQDVRRGSSSQVKKPARILMANVFARIDPIFVDLVKIAEEISFFDDDFHSRVTAIMAAKGTPREKDNSGLTDFRVHARIEGRKLALALSGKDFCNSVVINFDSYVIRFDLEAEVCAHLPKLIFIKNKIEVPVIEVEPSSPSQPLPSSSSTENLSQLMFKRKSPVSPSVPTRHMRSNAFINPKPNQPARKSIVEASSPPRPKKKNISSAFRDLDSSDLNQSFFRNRKKPTPLVNDEMESELNLTLANYSMLEPSIPSNSFIETERGEIRTVSKLECILDNFSIKVVIQEAFESPFSMADDDVVYVEPLIGIASVKYLSDKDSHPENLEQTIADRLTISEAEIVFSIPVAFVLVLTAAWIKNLQSDTEKLNKELSKSEKISVIIDKMVFLLHLPNDVEVKMVLSDISAGLGPWYDKQDCCTKVLRAFVEEMAVLVPKIDDNFGSANDVAWDEIVRVRQWNLQFWKKEHDSKMVNHFEVLLESIDFVIPHKFELAEVVEAVMHTKKCLKFLKCENFGYPTPEDIEIDKADIPTIIVSIEKLSLTLRDDPFETRLSRNYRIGLEEQAQRIQRNKVFQKKAAMMRAARRKGDNLEYSGGSSPTTFRY